MNNIIIIIFLISAYLSKNLHGAFRESMLQFMNLPEHGKFISILDNWVT